MTTSSTSRLGLYLPLGDIGASATETGTTTTLITNTSVDAGVVEDAECSVVDSSYALRERVTVTQVEADTPTAGKTTITFTPALSGNTVSGDKLYIDETIDIDTWMADQLDTIDPNLGAYVCTSSTRPTGSTRYTGQVIFEVDTHRIYRYSGADWVLVIDNDGRGRGVLDSDSVFDTGTSAVAQGAEQASPQLSVEVTLHKYRTYALVFDGSITAVGADTAGYLRWRYCPSSDTLSKDSTLLAQTEMDITNIDGVSPAHIWHATSEYYWQNATLEGSYKIGCFYARPATGDAKTGRFYYGMEMFIEDVGGYTVVDETVL